MFQDREITCIDCSQPFVFTAGEQDFYDKKGFKEEPKRCKPCREARKNKKQMGGYEKMQAGTSAGYDDESFGNRAESASTSYGFARSNRSYGGPGGPASAGKSNGNAGKEMFDAVCAQCGGAARVPFRPTPGRPVFCRDCFGSRAGGIS